MSTPASRLVDLTRLLDPADVERMPEPFRGWSRNLAPEVEPVHPWGPGAKVMCAIFGCEERHLPGGEGWGDEQLRITSHLGTHVDAPLHYGSVCEGAPARTISDIAWRNFTSTLWSSTCGTPRPAPASRSRRSRRPWSGRAPRSRQGGGVLVRTGQEAFDISDPRFFNYPGMTRAGTLFLAERGAKVLGTDALGWDRPFPVMRAAFEASGDPGEISDGHFAGRDREVFIVQQLASLAALPTHGFKVGFFPLRLQGCSAAPARVVAFLGA